MTKISDLTALTGAGVDDATDLLPIVDMSAAGAARNKKITIDETRIALGVSSADSPQFTAINLGHASDTTITRVSAGVVAVEGVNVVTTAGGVTFAADIIVPDEAYDATAWNGSLEVPTKNAVRDKIEALSIGGGVNVEDEGTPEATGATTLNFVGAGVTAADVGGGVVDVTIPGGGVSDLDDLSDVDTTGQTTGDVLTYDGAVWVPQAAFSGAKVRKSATLTAQNLTAGVSVTWNTEDWDTDSYHDTGSNTERLTAAVTGYYEASAYIRLANVTASDGVQAAIQRFNSSAVFQETVVTQRMGVNATSTHTNAYGQVHMSAGDYLIVVVLVVSDTSVDIHVDSNFLIRKIG